MPPRLDSQTTVFSSRSWHYTHLPLLRSSSSDPSLDSEEKEEEEEEVKAEMRSSGLCIASKLHPAVGTLSYTVLVLHVCSKQICPSQQVIKVLEIEPQRRRRLTSRLFIGNPRPKRAKLPSVVFLWCSNETSVMRSGGGRRTAEARAEKHSGEICGVLVEALWLSAKSSALFAFILPTLKSTDVAELFYFLFGNGEGRKDRFDPHQKI